MAADGLPRPGAVIPQPGQPCHSWWLWWRQTNLLLSTATKLEQIDQEDQLAMSKRLLCSFLQEKYLCSQWQEHLTIQYVDRLLDYLMMKYNIEYRLFVTLCVCKSKLIYHIYICRFVCVSWCHCGDKIEPRLHEYMMFMSDLHAWSNHSHGLTCVSSNNGQFGSYCWWFALLGRSANESPLHGGFHHFLE